MLELKGLSKAFGTKEVLKDGTLTIPDRSILGLVGINGAGKSTLLRMLAGILAADAGEILVDGAPVFENPRTKNKIFFLPDDPMYTQMTTPASLAQLYKTFYAFNEAAFHRVLGKFKLSKTGRLNKFSKGMRRQVFVALAIACEPQYLFLDEVFDGLDPLARMVLKRELKELNFRLGTTIVISSHSLRELEDFCAQFVLIDDKSLLEKSDAVLTGAQYVRLQAIFSELPTEALFAEIPHLALELIGHAAHITLQAKDRPLVEALAPLFVTEIPFSFEDAFISEVESRGYLK